MRQISRILAVGAAAIAALLLAVLPAAATTFDDVGAALRSDPLYIDPKSPIQLSSSEQQQVRQAIAGANTPLFMAVLPQAALRSAGGDPNAVLERMRNSTGLPGTYAVLVDTSATSFGFQARSTLGSVGALASQAYYDNQSNPTATMVQFADEVGQLAASGGLSGNGGDTSDPATDWAGLAFIGVLGVGGLGGVWYLRRKAKVRNAEATETVRKTLDEDITAFGEALDLADTDLGDPRLGDEGRADLQAALDSYESAKKASAAMTSPDDAATVTAALDEGRWRVACVEARLAGEPLPERRAPCFFDPRHGQSVEDVPYAPDGGAVRDVPACAACAHAVKVGASPNVRMVEAGGRSAPYWNSGRDYAGYAQGYYRSNTDLFSTIFMATMLGNMMAGSSFGGYSGADYSAGGSSSWGGGNSSGGWFDGGGGGGWGGGGGDFGGGGGGW